MPQQPRTILLAAGGVLAAAALVLVGRYTASPPAPAPAPSASASPALSASAPPEPAELPGSDDLRPVYPVDAGPPDPAAQRFCDAVYALPGRRRAECCGGKPGLEEGLAGQCVRVLTYAIGSRALTVAAADIDRCVEAMTQATSGCDWVKPYGLPPVPPACLGLLHGALGPKAQCRSSLECADGMRCRGLSTIDLGRCGPPAAQGACAVANDMLATFTRQDDLERAHPECEGACVGHRCAPALAEGVACVADAQCGKGRCVAGKCSSAPPAGVGEPCGECAHGLRCLAGKCAAPRPEGAACSADGECRGLCARGDGGVAGTCAKTCAAAVGWPFSPASAKPAGR
jgi:hypothetical protein